MRYRVVLYIAIALALLGVLFVREVPGATDGTGRFTDDLWLNTYFVFMGFVVTTAVVGPLIALFLEWREQGAWQDARANVRDRFASALRQVVDEYGAFLRFVKDEGATTLSDMLLSNTRRALEDFVDVYETEQNAFSAEMHSSASNLRRQLISFKRSLETTDILATRKRSKRLYIGTPALNIIRALVEHPPLTPKSALAADKDVARDSEVFLDFRQDMQLGAGSMPIHAFSGLDWPALERTWAAFLDACPSGRRAGATDALAIHPPPFDEAAQAKVHATYARARIEESVLANAAVARSWRAPR